MTCTSSRCIIRPIHVRTRCWVQRRWRDRRAVARAVRRATRVTVCTHYMARLAAEHGVHADIIPLGVPGVASPTVPPAEGPPWRLLRVASINPVKDYPTLLR